MGASNFYTKGKGATIGMAYKNAVEEAYYESGHDAYNGTISTTQGCIDVSSYFPPRTTQKSKIKVMLRIIPISCDPEDSYAKKLLKELTPAMRPVAQRLIKEQLGNVHKWGPCLGCRLDKTLFCFVGWAAE